MLWHHPELLYTFTTHSAVVSKLTSGANLMLPGVVTDVPINFHSYGKLKKGTPVAIVTDNNKVKLHFLKFLFQKFKLPFF